MDGAVRQQLDVAAPSAAERAVHLHGVRTAVTISQSIRWKV